MVSGRFLLVVGRFRLFQVVPRFSKYHLKLAFITLLNKKNSHTDFVLKINAS